MSSAPGYDIDDTIGGNEDAEAFANGSAYFGCAEALGGVLGVAEIGEKFVGGGGDGSCTATFIGGVDSKTIMNYADSLNSLTKEKLVDSILGVFSELNIKTSGSTNEEKLQSLAKTLRTKEFKEGSNFDVVVKKISQAINSHFQSEVVPASSNSLSNKQRIDLIAQFMRSLSHGVHSEFLSLYNDFADVLKTGHMIKNALKLTRDGYTETIEKSTDTYLSTALLQKKELWDLLLDELDRFLKMLGELTSVSLTPTDESLANLIKYDENNKLVFLPTYGEKSNADSIQNKISSMLVNTGTTGALVEAIQKCLKTIGLTMSQYIKGTEGKLYSAVLEKMTKESLSDDDAIHLLECVKFLSGNYYKIKDIEKKFEEMSNSKQGGVRDDRPKVRTTGREEYDDSYDGHGEDMFAGGAYSEDSDLTATQKRVKIIKAEKQLIVNAFQKQAYGIFKQIISSVETIARAVGRDVPLSPALEDFRQQLLRIGTAFVGKKNIWHILIGMNARDALSLGTKNDVVSDLKMLNDRIDVLTPTLGDSSYFKALQSSVRALLALIEQYSSSVSAKFGSASPFITSLRTKSDALISQAKTAATKVANNAAEMAGDAARGLSTVALNAASNAASRIVDHVSSATVGNMTDAFKRGIINGVNGRFEGDWATDNFGDNINGAGEDDEDDVLGGASVFDIKPVDTFLTSTTSRDFYKAIAELDARISSKQIEQNLKNAGKDMELYGKEYSALVTNSLKDLFVKAENRFNNMRDKLNEAIEYLSVAGQGGVLNTPGCKYASSPELVMGELKAAGQFLAAQHESRKRFWDTVNHLDQYLRFFTDSVLKNPSAVQKAIESLNDINVFQDWYREETGNNLIKIFEMFPSHIIGHGNTDGRFFDSSVKGLPGSGHYYQRVHAAIAAPATTGVFPGNPYLVTYPTVGLAARKQTRVMLGGFGVLKNIVSVFVGLGAKFGGDDARISGLMTPSQMYANLIDYIQASAFAQGWSWSVTEQAKATDTTTVTNFNNGNQSSLGLNKFSLRMGVRPRGAPDEITSTYQPASSLNFYVGVGDYFQNYRPATDKFKDYITAKAIRPQPVQPTPPGAWYIRKNWGVWMRSVNPILKRLDPFDFRREDEFFILMLKSMSAKIFTVAGLYDMMLRPSDMDTRRLPLRMVLGGSQNVVVEEGAVELYLRLPLLLQFYRKLFAMSGDSVVDGFQQYTVPLKDQDLKIAMLPDVDGIFGGLIRLVFRKNRIVDQTVYSNEDVADVVREVNAIYAKMKASHPKDTVAATITELVAEVNRRYGVVSKTDTIEYERENGADDYARPTQEMGDFVDDFAILPGEEEDEGVPYIPSEARRALGLSNDSEATAKSRRGIADGHQKLVRNFRCLLDKLMEGDKNDRTEDHKSFNTAIKQAQMKLRAEQRGAERLQIVGALIRGLDITTRADTLKYLMFHETVVAGLNTLSAMHSLLVRFQRTIIALDIDKLSEYVIEFMITRVGVNCDTDMLKTCVFNQILRAARMDDGTVHGLAVQPNAIELSKSIDSLLIRIFANNKFTAEHIAGGIAADSLRANYLRLPAETPLHAGEVIQRNPAGVVSVDLVARNPAQSIYAILAGHDLTILLSNMRKGNEKDPAVRDARLFFRLLFDHEFIMKVLLETLYSLSNDMGGMVEIKLTDRVNISMGNLRSSIKDMFDSVESMLGFFRPHIDKNTIDKYTNKMYAGSFYWLHEQLNEKLFRGREARGAEFGTNAAAGYISLDQCARRADAIFQSLIKTTIGNARGLILGGQFVPNNEKLTISYDKVFAELIFYNAVRGQSGVLISKSVGKAVVATNYTSHDLLRVVDYQHNQYDQLHISCQGSQRTLDTRFICRFANLYSWDDDYNNNRSALFSFNQLIAKFIYSFYDNATRVMYSALINPFVNGVFNKAVFDYKYTYPDTVPLLYVKDNKPESIALPNTYSLNDSLTPDDMANSEILAKFIEILVNNGTHGATDEYSKSQLFNYENPIHLETIDIVVNGLAGTVIDAAGIYAVDVNPIANQLLPESVLYLLTAALAMFIKIHLENNSQADVINDIIYLARIGTDVVWGGQPVPNTLRAAAAAAVPPGRVMVPNGLDLNTSYDEIYSILISGTAISLASILKMSRNNGGIIPNCIWYLYNQLAAAQQRRVFNILDIIKHVICEPEGPRQYVYGPLFGAFAAAIKRSPFKKDASADNKYKCGVVAKVMILTEKLRKRILLTMVPPPDYNNNNYTQYIVCSSGNTSIRKHDITASMALFRSGISDIVSKITSRTPSTYYKQDASPASYTIPWDEIPLARHEDALKQHVRTLAFDVGYLFMPRADPDPDFPLGPVDIDKAGVPALGGNYLDYNAMNNFGERVDPDGDHVLFASLAEILRNIVSNKSIAGNIPMAIVENISDVSGFMKEKYKANLPVFRNLFKELSGKCDFLTQFLNHSTLYAEREFDGYNTPNYHPWPYTLVSVQGITSAATKQRFSAILASINKGCVALSGACDDVLRQVVDEPKYMETCLNMTKDYKAQHNIDPLILLSSSLRFVADPSTRYLPLYQIGDEEFKYMYGTRGLFGALSGVPSLALLGGFSAVVDHHNAVADQHAQLDKSKLEAFAKVYIKLLRYIYQQRVLKGSLAQFVCTEATQNTADNPTTRYMVDNLGAFYREPLVAVEKSITTNLSRDLFTANEAVFGVISAYGMDPRNRSDVSMIGDRVLHDSVDNKDRYPRPTYQLDQTLAEVNRLSETPQRDDHIKRITDYIMGVQSTTHENLMLRNILDLNLIPINVNAMMRDIPFVALYNYAYTWDRLIVEHHYGVGGRNTAKIIGELCSDPPLLNNLKNAKDMLVKLLIDPHYNFHAGTTNATLSPTMQMIRGVFDGVADNGTLGRPKFISDVIDSVVFGEVYTARGKYNEMGPAAASSMSGRGQRVGGYETKDIALKVFEKLYDTAIIIQFENVIPEIVNNAIKKSVINYFKQNYDVFTRSNASPIDIIVLIKKFAVVLYIKIFNTLPDLQNGWDTHNDNDVNVVGFNTQLFGESARKCGIAALSIMFAYACLMLLRASTDILTAENEIYYLGVGLEEMLTTAFNHPEQLVVLNINGVNTATDIYISAPRDIHIAAGPVPAAVVPGALSEFVRNLQFEMNPQFLNLSVNRGPKVLHWLDEVSDASNTRKGDPGASDQPDNDNVRDPNQVQMVDVTAISDQLETIGACRFDTVLIRNLTFMCLLQRATQSKLRADFGGAGLRRLDGPIASAPQFMEQPRATNLFGNQVAKDKSYDNPGKW